MNSPIVKTLIMAVMAITASVTAAYFYPWPTEVAESDFVGKPLFETYETSSVRQIRIQRFNDDRGGLDRILLRRRGEKWVIPAKKDFIAGNARQISLAANSLIESTVLQDVTDEQQAYLEYGVVDPDEFSNTPNRSALGTKIILQDRDMKEIASLIIGKPVKSDPKKLQHFVRIPGQPNVYVIEFNAAALKTDFRSWIDPNLFDVRDPTAINKVAVNNYKVDKDKIGIDQPQQIYRAQAKLKPSQNRILIDLNSVEFPSEDGKWKTMAITPEVSQPFQALGMQSIGLYFPDVQLKSKSLIKALRVPKADAKDLVFDELKPYGFARTGFTDGSYQFTSVGGEVVMESSDGVVVTLYIGGIADKSGSSDLQLNYYVMMAAHLDESILPEPEKPADPEDKAYLRLVEERNQKIKSAKLRVEALNQRYAPWYYVISEGIISNIRPDIPTPVSTQPATGDSLQESVNNAPAKQESSSETEAKK